MSTLVFYLFRKALSDSILFHLNPMKVSAMLDM